MNRPDTPREAAMRHDISLAYPGDKWKDRVERMEPEQVVAVYHRLSTTGKLEEVAEERRREASASLRYGKQLSFFDKGYGL